jgi:imidazolonepropionase-like amidohydrolase
MARATVVLVTAIVFVTVTAVVIGRQPANPVIVRAGDTVITGGFLFDGVRDTVVPNTGIVVRSGISQSVGANVGGVDLAGATVVRLSSDDYVLPGLFDLHAHYAMDQEVLRRGRLHADHIPVPTIRAGVSICRDLARIAS